MFRKSEIDRDADEAQREEAEQQLRESGCLCANCAQQIVSKPNDSCELCIDEFHLEIGRMRQP